MPATRKRQSRRKGFAAIRKSLNGKESGARLGGASRADERRLVAAARRGDMAALRRLLQLVSGPVYRFGRTFCGNAEDAEEVLQDVMVALARGVKDFRGDAALTSWAYVVARNTCGRKRRRRSGEPAHVHSLDDADVRGDVHAIADARTEPSAMVEHAQLRDALQSAIASLPPAQREVILLRDVEGLPAREVAKTLKIGERAAKSRLHRARTALRDALHPVISEEQPAGKRCPDTVRVLSRFLEGEIDSSACERMEEHVRGCRRCGMACDALQVSLRSCRRWGNAPIPPDMRMRIRDSIRLVVSEARREAAAAG